MSPKARNGRDAIRSGEKRWANAITVACLATPIAWFVVAMATGMTSRAPGTDVTIIFVVAASLVGVGALALSAHPTRLDRLGLAWVSLLFWALVAAVSSGRGYTALFGEVENGLGWFALVGLAVCVWAGRAFSKPGAEVLRRWAPWMIAFQATVVAAQAAGLLPGSSGTLPNSTYLGLLVVLLLPWVLKPSTDDTGAWSGARAAVVFVGMVLLGAVGARIGLAAAVVWLGWQLLARTPGRVLTKMAALGLTVAVATGAAWTFARVEVAGMGSLETFGQRPAMWLTAWRGALASPLTGWGPDGFIAGGAASSSVDAARNAALLVIQPGGQPDPHSLVAWILVSLGFVGMALVGWIVVETVLVWRGRALGLNTAGAWATGMALAVLLTAPLPLQLLPLLGLVYGLSLTRTAENGFALTPPRGAGVAAGIAVSVVLLAWMASASARAPYEAADAARSPQLARRAQAAAELWFFDAHLAFLASRQWSYAGRADDTTRLLMLTGLQRASELDRRSPYHPLYWAIALRDTGADSTQVEAAFDEAISRYPFHPFARVERAALYAMTGRPQLAREDLEVARLVDRTQVPEIDAMIARVESMLSAQP